MRNIYFLICFFLTVGTIGSFSPFFDIDFSGSTAGGTTYAVEIAKYKYPVYTDYFDDVNDVVELTASNGEYHYLAGLTTSKKEAEELVIEIKSQGYTEAKLIDLNTKFSKDQIAGILPYQQESKKITKNQKITKQTIQKNSKAAKAIGELSNVGNSYFYTILLQKSKVKLNAKAFAPLQGVKPVEEGGHYQYLYGRFDDVADAQKYLNDKLSNVFPGAYVAILNNGEISKPRLAKIDKSTKKNVASNSGSYNMGRKMRGKEYVDYYYELTSFGIAKKPSYVIEIGEYHDKNLADEAVQKLKDLGFADAKIQDLKLQKDLQGVGSKSTKAHYTIQVFASKSKMDAKRLNIKDVSRSFDQEDEIYRYFHGDYDNYWVCRRELREVRKNGFDDAFIVKL